jgi:aminoglycoside 6'-N-acetyltransferase
MSGVSTMIFFQSGSLIVRKLVKEDNYLLVKWLSDPAVLEYYEGRDNPFNIDKVNDKFFADKDETVRCIVEFEDKEIGYIQYYPLEDEERNIYGYLDGTIFGIDQFIGEVDYWNKGIGTLLVKAMVKFLIEQKNADRVVMDPQIMNVRALKCYEKCGFKKVKLLPRRELHEGTYQDCWLIEYLNMESRD